MKKSNLVMQFTDRINSFEKNLKRTISDFEPITRVCRLVRFKIDCIKQVWTKVDVPKRSKWVVIKDVVFC